jgi:Domain of unknown function (DUF397)
MVRHAGGACKNVCKYAGKNAQERQGRVTRVTWRRSGQGAAPGSSVEIAVLESGEIGMRDSADPDGPMLVYTRAELAAFLDGARKGEFDDLVG